MLVRPGMTLVTILLTPLKLNAWPTSPAANATPPSKTPLLVPVMSCALPSPGHQATKPDGEGTQSAANARNVTGKKIRPAITHHQARMNRSGGLTDFAGREGPSERTDETIFIGTFQLF